MTRSPRIQAAGTRLLVGAFAASLLMITGCRAQATGSPEDLRRAYLDAVRRDDPAAAYALLAPETQARISAEAFAERWKSDRAELEAQLDASKQAKAPVVLEGRTTHPGGRELRWTEVGGRYLVVNGLPGVPSTLTPEATVRSFLAALRRAPVSSIEALIAPELSERVIAAWADRADAIEEALQRPGSIEIGEEYERAVLRYGVGGLIVLERAEGGWRIVELR
jgi:hypothetical protein